MFPPAWYRIFSTFHDPGAAFSQLGKFSRLLGTYPFGDDLVSSPGWTSYSILVCVSSLWVVSVGVTRVIQEARNYVLFIFLQTQLLSMAVGVVTVTVNAHHNRRRNGAILKLLWEVDAMLQLHGSVPLYSNGSILSDSLVTVIIQVFSWAYFFMVNGFSVLPSYGSSIAHYVHTFFVYEFAVAQFIAFLTYSSRRFDLIISHLSKPEKCKLFALIKIHARLFSTCKLAEKSFSVCNVMVLVGNFIHILRHLLGIIANKTAFKRSSIVWIFIHSRQVWKLVNSCSSTSAKVFVNINFNEILICPNNLSPDISLFKRKVFNFINFWFF